MIFHALSVVDEKLIPSIFLWEALHLLSFKNLLVDTFGSAEVWVSAGLIFCPPPS